MALALGACTGDDAGDDGDAGAADGDTTASTAAAESSTGGDAPATTDGAGPSTGSPQDGTTAEDTAEDTTTGDVDTGVPADSSGSSGDLIGPIELTNDGWQEGSPVAYMGGFAQGECWASTYVPEPEHYPFVVDAVRMLVGGEDMGEADFSLGVWSVDGDGQPDAEIASASVTLTGADGDVDAVNLGVAGIESPVYDEGNFAIVVCLTSHGGPPAIGADADGQVDFEDRNWIRLEDGTWTRASDLGVGGDWVMRAVTVPAI